jgi:hypothetical protein
MIAPRVHHITPLWDFGRNHRLHIQRREARRLRTRTNSPKKSPFQILFRWAWGDGFVGIVIGSHKLAMISCFLNFLWSDTNLIMMFWTSI